MVQLHIIRRTIPFPIKMDESVTQHPVFRSPLYCFIVYFSEKGICLPTVFLWLLFVYIEASIRLKEFKANIDLKHLPFHLDLCRPFAAHW